MKRNRTQLGTCIQLTGDPTSAVVLYYLKSRKPNRVYENRKFIVRSYDDLMFDTGLSRKQVEIALKRLRDLGLIMSEQHLVWKKSLNHFQLTKKFEIEFKNKQKADHTSTP